MTRKDFELIASALADVEAHVEDFGDERGFSASTLRLVVDNLAGRIAQEHPRFNAGLFEKAALPIQSARMVAAITKALEMGTK